MFLPISVFALADNAKSNILINYETGTIINENKSHEHLPPASMTKMMSLLLIMEALDQGKIKLNDSVLISENAASMGGSQVYLAPNTHMPLETLLKAVAIASANDAIVALAEHLSGSVDEFVKLMNKKCDTLNLKDSNFKNVHGLDEKDHYSSAYDMAFIAKELLKYPDILKYTTIYEDYVKHPDGTSTWIVNTNKLINYYKGLDGLKTGYTKNSGYCITATAKRDNMRLISVVMGEENNNIRNQETMELLNYGFSNYKLKTIVSKKTNLGKIKVDFGNVEEVDVTLMENANHLVNSVDDSNYSYEVKLDKVKAPLKYKDKVGTLNIYQNDVKINSYDLTVKEEVKKASIFNLLIRNIKYLLKGSF